ncbi:dihydroorotase [Lecanora helva]
MELRSSPNLDLPPTADLHVHLRQDAMMELVTPQIQKGGCDTVYVMPNLQPPITTVAQALDYHGKLAKLAPDVTFLMSLFLHPSLTPEAIREAAETGVIYGVKLYPAGVTTNSQDGVLDIEQYYHIFKAMEEHDLVLNLHGEMTGSPPDVTTLNAEAKFVPQLCKLYQRFPFLRIVLEHVSTREGLEAVRKCGPTVAGTITAHHLWVTNEDATQDAFSFCKPVAKTLEDRKALVRAVLDPSSRFFFGSDSAPHPVQSKRGPSCAAGCFTQGWTTSLVIGALQEGLSQGWIRDEDVTREALEGFLSRNGRKFYGLPQPLKTNRIFLEKRGETIPQGIKSQDRSIEVVPFRAGKEVMSLSWL